MRRALIATGNALMAGQNALLEVLGFLFKPMGRWDERKVHNDTTLLGGMRNGFYDTLAGVYLIVTLPLWLPIFAVIAVFWVVAINLACAPFGLILWGEWELVERYGVGEFLLRWVKEPGQYIIGIPIGLVLIGVLVYTAFAPYYLAWKVWENGKAAS